MPWGVEHLKMAPEQAEQEAQRMRFEGEVVPEALDRLRRVHGQLGGIIRMIEQGRDCQDVVQQLAAVGRAVDRVGLRLLTGQLRQCLIDDIAARDEGYDEDKFERLFLMLT
jgi:DNA-binding FrmR family transcriptional regulator